MIRLARVGDAPSIAILHLRSWQTAYRGIASDALLDGLDVEEWTRRREQKLREADGRGVRNWVLEADGRIVAWAAVGPARDTDLGEETEELYAIYVLPAAVGQGHGRALLAHCVAEARAGGRSEMALWVLSANARARRFYEAAGFVADPRVPERLQGEIQAPTLRLCRSLG